MSTIVCVHGAFRGGWSFERVRSALAADGHDVRTPSLTGMGDRSHIHPDHVPLSMWIDDVVSLLTLSDLRNVILVGHSQGGLVTTAVSGRCPERLSQLVFVDAVEPGHGQRGVDLMGGAPPMLPPATTWIPPTPLDSGSGLDRDDIAWVNERLGATPLGPSLDPVDLSHPEAARVPRRRLFCAGTPETYPSSFARRELKARGAEMTIVDEPHDVLISAPALVARFILELRTLNHRHGG